MKFYLKYFNKTSHNLFNRNYFTYKVQCFLQEVIECGIVNCAATSRKSFMKMSAVIFGSDDYCADLQIGRSFDATELLYARQKIVTTTSAYNMQAIDMVYIDFKGNCYD